MTEPSPARRLVITIALMSGTFLASLDVTVVGTVMPSIAADLGGLHLYGWVFSAYLLASTVTVPLYGKIADRLGRRAAYLTAIVVFLVGSAACGFATSMPLLIAARALQGMGAGGIVPITLVTIGDLYPVAQRVRVMSIFSLVWGVSSVIGPTLGGLLAPLGWPWVFFVNLPIGGVVCVAVALTMLAPKERKAARVDLAGAALVSGATLSLLGSMNLVSSGAWVPAAALAAASIVLGAAFVRVERRAPDAIVPPALFADRVLSVASILGVLIGGVLFIAIAYVPLYMRAVAGTSLATAGAALIPMSLSWTLAAFVSGRLILRTGYRLPVRAGAMLVGAGSVGLVLSSRAGSVAAVVVSAGFLGAGMGLSVTPTNIAAQERVPFEMRGAATALLQFSRTMGGSVFVSLLGAIMGAVLAARLARVEGAPAPSDLVDPDRVAHLAPETLAAARSALDAALGWVFIGASVLGVAAAIVSLAYPRVPLPRTSVPSAPGPPSPRDTPRS